MLYFLLVIVVHLIVETEFFFWNLGLLKKILELGTF